MSRNAKIFTGLVFGLMAVLLFATSFAHTSIVVMDEWDDEVVSASHAFGQAVLDWEYLVAEVRLGNTLDRVSSSQLAEELSAFNHYAAKGDVGGMRASSAYMLAALARSNDASYRERAYAQWKLLNQSANQYSRAAEKYNERVGSHLGKIILAQYNFMIGTEFELPEQLDPNVNDLGAQDPPTEQ